MSNNLGNKQIMAKNIQYYMNLHGKTRQEMCDALGVKYTTFTDWVNMKQPNVLKNLPTCLNIKKFFL